jgi:hypothetical protein
VTDLAYHPVSGDAEQRVSISQPKQLLVLGDPLPDSIGAAGECRWVTSNEPGLPTGIYEFDLDGSISMLVVADGGDPGPVTEAAWDAGDDHPLISAYEWFCHLWDTAEPVAPPQFAAGDDVLTVPGGEEATIRSRQHSGGTWWYDVRVGGRTVAMRESKLSAPQLDDDPSAWISRPASSARRLAATLTRAKLRDQLTDTLYSFRASRTVFRPYQFRPVIGLLAAGTLRLLIADEVGLGKTIEAGLVWTELEARSQANRVLVVCPSMLVSKWRAEMDERFGYRLDVLDKAGLDDLLERVDTDRLPPRYQAICSIERLRVWSGLEQLAEISPHFDLVIVDEAHAFRNSDTKSHALGALLADWADALVLLSATPLNLGNEDLFNLLRLLAPGDFDDPHVFTQRLEPNAVLNRIASSLLDRSVTNVVRRAWLTTIEELAFGPAVIARPEYARLDQLLRSPSLDAKGVTDARRHIARLHALAGVVTRTRKVEIQDRKAVREARRIDVEWTEAESSFYRAFDAWQRADALRRGLPVGFVTQMPLRLASTCLPAARDLLLAEHPAPATDDDPDDLFEDDGQPGTSPPPQLLVLAQQLGERDTKFDALLAALEPIVAEGKRVLLFTFSRRALAYLERRLVGRVRLASLHGGVRSEDRHDIMRRFRAHDFDVLVASRVASEGLDFEFCSAVVNYDLPWNPMEVEQRMEPNGRLENVDVAARKVLTKVAGPARLGTMHAAHFIADVQGWVDLIERSRSVTGLMVFTVASARAWLDEAPTPSQRRGLINEDADLILLAVAAATNRVLVDGGRPVPTPEIGQLRPDWELVARDLPDQLTWERALQRAGDMGVVPVSRLRSVTAVVDLTGRLQDLGTRTIDGAGSLIRELDAARNRLGLDRGTERSRTAQAALDLVTTLARRPEQAIVALAGAEVPTTVAAIGTSLEQAAPVAAALGATNWDLLDTAFTLPEPYAADAVALRTRLVDAVGVDELTVALASRLADATRAATDLVGRAARRPSPPPPPAPAGADQGPGGEPATGAAVSPGSGLAADVGASSGTATSGAAPADSGAMTNAYRSPGVPLTEGEATAQLETLRDRLRDELGMALTWELRHHGDADR